jgi:hypothetical protein
VIEFPDIVKGIFVSIFAAKFVVVEKDGKLVYKLLFIVLLPDLNN